MVNLLEIPRMLVSSLFFFFFNYRIELLRFFHKRTCVLSSEHEHQNLATIGTLVDQFMLSCK